MVHKKLFSEGNGGGDFFRITEAGDGLLKLAVGHCNVVMIDAIVPVEFLTAAIADVVIRHEGAIQFLQSTNWPDDYKDELAGKVKDTFPIIDDDDSIGY
jgi:hypothetical protein